MSHTIAAVSTGNQICAIGIVRMSGDDCIAIADQVFHRENGTSLTLAPDRKMVLGDLFDKSGRMIDRCLAVCSRAPHTYTGEDTVEFHCHGSPAVLAAVLESLFHAGAQPAQRGEYTKRAFLNGRLDLTQAEAVIDLIESETADAAVNAAGQVGGVLQKKIAPIYDDLTDICSHFHAVLDYPDEDIDDFRLENYRENIRRDAKALYELLQTFGQGRILRNGAEAVIVGKPNVGKSSLLNAIAGYERVIVTDIAGTTRDTVEEAVMLGKTRLRLIDTAGIRSTGDKIEAMGVERSLDAAERADLVLMVVDGSEPLTEEDRQVILRCSELPKVIALINKSDLGNAVTPADLPFDTVICMSAKNGDGLDQLSQTVDELFAGTAPCDGSILTNPRQYDAISRAYEAMLRLLQGIQLGQTPDMVLLDAEDAMTAMGEVTGATVREDITARIFERFCVGK